MARPCCYIAFVMYLFLASFVLAEEKSSMTVDEVISLALERSPLVEEIESRAVGKKAEGVSLRTLENPELDAEVSAPVSYSGSRSANQIDVSLSQPLRPSDFGARERVNALLSKTSDQERAIALVELAQALRLLYVKAWATEEQLRQVQSGREQAKKLSRLIKAGVSQALYGPADLALVDASEKKLLAEQTGLEADVARTKAELTRKSGVPVQTAALARPVFSPLDVSSLSDPALPIRARAEALVRLSREQAKLAKLDSYPRFAPRFVYSRDEEGASYVGAGISVDLPFFDRNQGERLRSEAELSAAKSIEGYLAGPRFSEEIALLLAAVDASKRQAEVYDAQVVPAVQRSFEAYERAFKQGQGSAFQLLETLNALTEAKTKGLEIWVRAQSERSEISVLVGKDI